MSVNFSFNKSSVQILSFSKPVEESGLPEDVWARILSCLKLSTFELGRGVVNFSRVCKWAYTLSKIPAMVGIVEKTKDILRKQAEERMALSNLYFDFPGSNASFN